MHVKTINIIGCLKKKGRVIVKLANYPGVRQIVISRRANGNYVVGKEPGSALTSATERDVESMIDSLHMFIERWHS